MDLDALRRDTLRWLRRRYSLSEMDSEDVAHEGFQRLYARYVDVDRADWVKILRKICSNLVVDRHRRRSVKQAEVPRPAVPASRYHEFVLSLGFEAAKELMRWHQGVSVEDSAAMRGIQPRSVSRMRKRIALRWQEYLKGCQDLSAAERRAHQSYLEGNPTLADIQ